MSYSLPHLPRKDGEPAWEAAYFFPPQGRWSEETFLQSHTNQMAELVNGHLEILPPPNVKHQRILRLLLGQIEGAVPTGSMVLFEPLPTKLFPGTIREPDLLYIAPVNIPGPEIQYPSKIDLVVEIVSDGVEARKRDYEDKRIDYAKAGIREYWIVDPQDRVVTVLVLEGEQYVEHGKFTCGQTATGQLLPAFAVDVQSIMSN